MIGIFIGIASVVALISLSEGLQNNLNEQFELLGADLIYIYPGSSMMSIGTSTDSLSEHDLELIRRVPGVSLASAMSSKISKIKYRDEIKYTFVVGLLTDESQDILLKEGGISIEKGQKEFKKNDMYKVAIGHLLAEGDFFDKPVDVGDTLIINDKKFKVIGIVSKIGNPSDDSQIYIPIDAMNDVFGVKENEYIAVMAKVKGGTDVEKVAEDITKRMRRDRGLSEGDEDFQVTTSEQIRESANSILTILQAIVVAIGGISLIVGGVGIMNSMYTSVLERTQEIGVMKAIGAKNSDILTLFLIESGIIGLVGGAIGCILGGSLAKIIEFIGSSSSAESLFKASITPELILGALGFSFIVGCFFGVLPARQASKLKPVEALRYE